MNTLRTHPVRFWTLIALAIALGVGLLTAITPGSAHSGAVTTDKPDYTPSETVVISGSGFGASESLDVPVIRPGGTIVRGDGTFTAGWDTVVADGAGNFTYSYVLDGILGTYTVEVYHTPWGGPASGETPLASTTFTDAAIGINMDQCHNDTLLNLGIHCGDNGASPPKWANGDINSGNSQYREADGIPYRNSFTKVSNGTWTARVDYDFTKGGIFALDRLTKYNLTQQSDPCGAGSAVTCTEGASAFEFEMPGEVVAPDATHPALASGGALDVAGTVTPLDNVCSPCDTKMRIWSEGGTATFVSTGQNDTGVQATSFNDNRVLQNGLSSGDSDREFAFKFTLTGCPGGGCNIMMGWTGHVASANDWGAGKGASSITGAPFHMRIEGIDNLHGTSGGNQDRSVQLSAVIPPGSITVCKNVVPDDASTWSFSITGPTSVPAFSQGDNACHTASPLAPGTYTVSETTSAGYSTSVACDNGASDGASVTFFLNSLDTVNCTFTNIKTATPTPTITPTVTPTPTATPTPTPTVTEVVSPTVTPTVTATVTPTPLADVKKVSLTVLSVDCASPPSASIDVSQNVKLCLRGVLHNNGPVTPVTVTDTSTAAAPADCTAIVTTPPTSHSLTTSVPVTVDHFVTIHCTTPSFHTFQFQNCLTVTTTGVTDPVPGNNCQSASYTPAVIGTANVSIVGFNCSSPQQMDVSESVDITCTKDLLNTGPFAASVTVTKTAAAPADCTITPPSASEQVFLPVNVPVQLVEVFTIHCLQPSFHDFTITNDIRIKDEHIVDPRLEDNGAIASFTVAAIAQTDLKQPVVIFPPGGSGTFPVSENILIPASVDFHNNGPLPVNAQDAITISFPADCDITVVDPFGTPIFGPVPGPGPLTFTQPLGLLPVSVSVTIGFNFSVHCTQPSFHTFIGRGCIEIDPMATLHVVDPAPSNNCFETTQTYALVAQADLKKVDIQAQGPAQIDVSEDAPVAVASVVHNNGPFGPVNASDVITASAPPDCTVNGGASASSSQQLILPVSEPTTVGAAFTVHCTKPSFHTFTFCNDIRPKDEHVEDPLPDNNRKCVDYTVAVIGTADVKLIDVQIPDSEKTAPVSEDVPFSLNGTIHNNGPDEADAQVSVSINLPDDCTLTLLDQGGQPILVIQGPGPLSFQGPVHHLPVSEMLPINASFTIHCFSPSFHVFTGQGCVNIVDGNQPPHVVDPEPRNNCFSVQASFAFTAQADVKKSFGVGGPPTANVSEDFQVGWGAILHNNGPFGPVNVDDTITVTGPADCTVNPPSVPINDLSLAVDAGIAIDGFFTLHCFNPSFHDFEFCNEVRVDQEHVFDPDLSNNKVCMPYTVAISGQADLKTVSITANGPGQIDVSQNTTITVSSVVHNNGPFGPVNASDFITAFAPPDCTVNGGTASGGPNHQLSLPVSESTTVGDAFTVHCTKPSLHTFTICNNDIRPKDEHVEDPISTNNQKCVDYTVAAIAKADVKVTGVVVTCDDPVDTATNFNCKVDVTVHNNGPYGPVNADVTVGLSGPTDCPAVPNQTANDLSLAVSVPQTVTKNFTVKCANRSFHTFTGTGSVAVDQLHVVDPNPNNNSGSGQYTTHVFDKADLKVTSVVVTCDDPVDVNTAFNCKVDVTVHNNGPTTPVNADVTVGLSFVPQPPQPASECTLTPAGNQSGQDLSLATSVPQVVTKTWSVTCTARSYHKFTGTGSIAVDQLHVRDPNTQNNSGAGDDTNSVFNLADVKVTSTMINCPPSSPPNTPFTCTVTITIHNNGPTSPVDVGGALNVGYPNDCTVQGYTPQGQGYGLLTLVASVSQTVVKTFNITCTSSGSQQIDGCGIIQPNQLHIRDPLLIGNNHGATAPVIVQTGSPAADPTFTVGRCDTFDPLEICGDGIDNDGDGLVDEEPDTDKDGANSNYGCDLYDPDDDNDGFSDVVETYLGTNPLLACPAPPDFNSDHTVDISDVLAEKPAFGTDVPPTSPRLDIAKSGIIDISDVLALKPYFGKSC